MTLTTLPHSTQITRNACERWGWLTTAFHESVLDPIIATDQTGINGQKVNFEESLSISTSISFSERILYGAMIDLTIGGYVPFYMNSMHLMLRVPRGKIIGSTYFKDIFN